MITVTAPPLPPAPKPEALCTLTFFRDIARPVRVDNEARACLDDIALTLQHQPESKLVIVGEHSADEPALSAAQRAVNTRAYLANEKGIDPARIEVRTSSKPGKTAENFLLAPGTTFEDTLSAPARERPSQQAGVQHCCQPGRRRSETTAQGTCEKAGAQASRQAKDNGRRIHPEAAVTTALRVDCKTRKRPQNSRPLPFVACDYRLREQTSEASRTNASRLSGTCTSRYSSKWMHRESQLSTRSGA